VDGLDVTGFIATVVGRLVVLRLDGVYVRFVPLDEDERLLFERVVVGLL